MSYLVVSHFRANAPVCFFALKLIVEASKYRKTLARNELNAFLKN